MSYFTCPRGSDPSASPLLLLSVFNGIQAKLTLENYKCDCRMKRHPLHWAAPNCNTFQVVLCTYTVKNTTRVSKSKILLFSSTKQSILHIPLSTVWEIISGEKDFEMWKINCSTWKHMSKLFIKIWSLNKKLVPLLPADCIKYSHIIFFYSIASFQRFNGKFTGKIAWVIQLIFFFNK